MNSYSFGGKRRKRFIGGGLKAFSRVLRFIARRILRISIRLTLYSHKVIVSGEPKTIEIQKISLKSPIAKQYEFILNGLTKKWYLVQQGKFAQHLRDGGDKTLEIKDEDYFYIAANIKNKIDI